MKKIISLSFLVFIAIVSNAQNPKYEAAMKSLVAKIEKVPYNESFVPLSNQMERIAAAEKGEWLPNYWVAYCQIAESYKKEDSDEKDLILDKAEVYLKKADALVKNNDEIEHLKAFYNNARMVVNPMVRWMTHGGKVTDHLAAAKKINPNNPRVALLEAEGVFYTPKMFGGGEEKAKPLFEKAKALYAAFTPKNEMWPNWGMYSVEYHLGKY